MKLIISVGNDWLGVNYKSKETARRSILRAKSFRKPFMNRDDDCVYFYKGRNYCRAELKEATVLTLDQFHKLMKP